MKIDLNKKEKLSISEDEPRGKNGLSSRASFIQEKVYHQKSFAEIEFFTINPPHDFRYESLLYGRVDENGFSVVPKEEALTQYGQPGLSAFSLNFVHDAFSEFYDFWELSKRRNFISEDSAIYDLANSTSFVNPVTLYENFMFAHYDAFLNFVNNNKFSKNIINFNSFIKIFVKFVELKTPAIPVLYSSFCSSKYCNFKINGLTIDVAEDDVTDDNIKYNKYVKDPNYTFFYNAINTFGFVVDKNVPWRIIANLDSKPMKKYILKYKTEEENTFDVFFQHAYLNDLLFLKDLITIFYNNYINNNLRITEPVVKVCKNNKFTINNNLKFRQKSTTLETEEFWLKTYLFLLAKEKNVNWDQSKFNGFVEQTLKILTALDLEQAMSYAHRSVGQASVEKRKNNAFSL